MLENQRILSKFFEIVELQIQNSLMLENEAFADLKEKELKKSQVNVQKSRKTDHYQLN